jgi:hypothetical protein
MLRANTGPWRNYGIGRRTTPCQTAADSGRRRKSNFGNNFRCRRRRHPGGLKALSQLRYPCRLTGQIYFSGSNGALHARNGALQATKGALHATKSTTTFLPTTLPLSLTVRPPASSSMALLCSGVSSKEIGPFPFCFLATEHLLFYLTGTIKLCPMRASIHPIITSTLATRTSRPRLDAASRNGHICGARTERRIFNSAWFANESSCPRVWRRPSQ